MEEKRFHIHNDFEKHRRGKTFYFLPGINIDLVFLILDTVLIFLFLAGLESGYLQLVWNKLSQSCQKACGKVPTGSCFKGRLTSVNGR